MFNRVFGPFRSRRRPHPGSVLKRASLEVESLGGYLLSGFRLRRPASVRAALVCEVLEMRVVPANLTWSGAAGDSIASNPANWAGGVAPVAGDSIYFPAANPSQVSIDPNFPATIANFTLDPAYAGTITLNRNLTVTGTLLVPNGFVQINGPNLLTAQTVNVGMGGSIGGPGGALSVTGSMTLSNATISLNSLSIGANASLNIMGPTTLITGQVSIDQNAALNISGDLTLDVPQFNQQGTAMWTAGMIELGGSTVFNNTGPFSIACANTITGSNTGTGTFNNYGIVSKGMAGVTQIWTTFNNLSLPAPWPPASVNVTAGELDFKRAGTHNAPFIVGPNSAIGFLGGGYDNVLEQGANLQGSGTVTVARGATLQVADMNTWIYSSVTFNLLYDGQVAPGVLSGGNFVSNGTFQWSGGQMENLSLTSKGPMQINATTEQDATNGSINLNGATTWTGGDIVLTQTPIINTGRFEIQNDQTMRPEQMGDTVSQFTNGVGGIFTKTGPLGGSHTTINIPFQQAGGDISLNGLRISFQGGLQQTAGASVTDLGNGGILLVAGTFTVTAGNVTGLGTIGGNLTLNGGTLGTTTQAGVGSITVSGNYQQMAGSTLKLKVGDSGGTPINDQLIVLGTATLGGTLSVYPITGAAVRAGDSFDLIDDWANQIIGTFNTWAPMVPGHTWNDPVYNANTVNVTAKS